MAALTDRKAYTAALLAAAAYKTNPERRGLHHAAVRRAVRSLLRAGLVECAGWHKGQMLYCSANEEEHAKKKAPERVASGKPPGD